MSGTLDPHIPLDPRGCAVHGPSVGAPTVWCTTGPAGHPRSRSGLLAPL